MATHAGRTTLVRALGPADAAAVIISNVIGVGILTAPGIVAAIVPQPLAMLSLWVAGGVLALAGANAYAQMATLSPLAGGEYVYLRDAFGPLTAFLSGWTSLVAGFSGAIAAGAVGFADYLGRYLPIAADSRPLLSISIHFTSITLSPQKIIALLLILILSSIHARGLGPGRILQDTLTAIKVLALLILIALGFLVGTGSVERLAYPLGTPGTTSWLLALIPVMFTYSGWNAASYIAEEVRNPVRNLPRALVLGTAAVAAVYLLLNTLYLYALPARELASVIHTGDAAAAALFGPRAAGMLIPFFLVALAGSVSAMILAGPRVYFAMARDGLFLRSAARVHPRYHTPWVAIAAQTIWSTILVLTGPFEQLLIYTGFAVVLFAGLAVAGLFVLRFRLRRSGLPYRGWGFPWAPAIFVIASFAMVANAIRERPVPSVAGLLVIISGLPIYWWFKKGKV